MQTDISMDSIEGTFTVETMHALVQYSIEPTEVLLCK